MAPSNPKPAASGAASKSKGKAPSRSAIGAPSQHAQTTRKGKKAWRKNVNMNDVEEVLEGQRAEERVTGTTLQQMQDAQLFQIDTKGDEQIRTRTRFSASQLTSAKILAQRSAVPAVFSRVTSGDGKRKAAVSREDKERLMRIAKRQRRGPFGSIMDPSEYAAGSAVVDLSAAVKESGSYDAWAPEPEQEEVKDGLETVQKKKAKAPIFQKTRDLIEVPAIAQPHQGTSYNPPADAHQALMEQAAAIEQRRLEQAARLAATKEKMEMAKVTQGVYDITVAPGMAVQKVDDEEEVDEEEGEGAEGEVKLPSKKMPERKTTSQKNKALRVLKEKLALAAKAERKRLLASINDAKAMRKSNARAMNAQELARQQRLDALAAKLKTHGLAGTKLGKHKVPEGSVVVQIGEDLSESLRGLKPEGNLFRDRFESLQQRALIEPRVPVIPTKRRRRVIEYEKHAWKNFDRD